MQPAQRQGDRAIGAENRLVNLAKGCPTPGGDPAPGSDCRECRLRPVKPPGDVKGNAWYVADYCPAPANMQGAAVAGTKCLEN